MTHSFNGHAWQNASWLQQKIKDYKIYCLFVIGSLWVLIAYIIASENVLYSTLVIEIEEPTKIEN